MNRSHGFTWLVMLALGLGAGADQPAPGTPWRQPLPPALRPLPSQQVLFVDPLRGQDQADGSIDRPLRTINHALTLVGPGTTVCLRAGVYFEHVYVAAVGTPEAPITLRAYPGEQAIIDGSYAPFQTQPAQAWRPVAGGAPDEFESVTRFANIHHPIGTMGDSMLGLQTYYHGSDLRAAQELIHYPDFAARQNTDHDPLYCGPGLWLNPDTGRIHARLAPTHVPGITNYAGVTDPRQLPLIIAPFHAVPLTIEGARCLVLQDLIIRGGGYDTVRLNLAQQVTFDRVTIYAGTYGLRAKSTTHLRLTDSAIHGNVPPWSFRSDTSKRDYPGKPTRNITRLNTHALLALDNGTEHDVYATPVNDHWEIAYCHFTDAHDGLYLGGLNLNFHHNLIENMQDDGLYLSQTYPRSLFARDWPTARIHQNLFRQVNMPLAFGAGYVAADNQSVFYICRNLFDQRFALRYSRPSTANPELRMPMGMFMGDHGSPPWAIMYLYHNTLIAGAPQRQAQMSFVTATHADRPRRVFNNIFMHLQKLPAYALLEPGRSLQCDANLYWSPNADAQQQAAFFARYRKSPQFEQSTTEYPPGQDANAVLADPLFVRCVADAATENDYRLTSGSPAVDAGVDLPVEWFDPLRAADAGRPDIGALPAGAPLFHVGPRQPE